MHMTEDIWAPTAENEARLGELELDEEYTFQLLSPKGVPEHTLRFHKENGVLRGIHATEHLEQEMRNLRRSGRTVSWSYWGGSIGDEMFTVTLTRYIGGVLAGTTKRSDTAIPAASSPVICYSKNPMWDVVRAGGDRLHSEAAH